MNTAAPDQTAPPQGSRILVIDDEAVIGLSCRRILEPAGYRVQDFDDSRRGLAAALTGDYDVVLVDLVMPEMGGLDVLRQIRAADVPTEVVIITAYSTVESAVEAMKLGAADYISKPFMPSQLLAVLYKVAERSALICENARLRQELDQCQCFQGMIGGSLPMRRVFSLLGRVAPTDGTVLVTGESGTGKEMIARAIHRLSSRRDHALLAFDCNAIVPTLLESELFGHVKGSFSGAVAAHKGLFEAAHLGTLFLDEVANLTLETQGKLLRVLETKRIRRVGDTAEREVDIRLVAATNRDLAEMAHDGRFREDLYYRLNVVPVELPPLRDRTGDIPVLAATFLEQCCQRNPVDVRGFTAEAMQALESYAWPGNVRELRNTVERVAILCDGPRIERRHLPGGIRDVPLRPTVTELPRDWPAFKQLKRQVRDAAVHDLERRFLRELLIRADGNVSRAAADSGLPRTHLHALLKRYELTADLAMVEHEPSPTRDPVNRAVEPPEVSDLD